MATRPAPPPRPPARIAVGILAAAVVLAAAPVGAQEEPAPSVRLTLRRQTPWVTAEDPRLQVEIRARNEGTEPLGDLALGIALWPAVRSRTAYEASLTEDPLGALPLLALTRPLQGELAPGEPRTFRFRLDLSFLAGLSDRSLVYPLRVEVRSGAVPVGVLRTPVIHLVRRPEVPLDLAWWWELHEPIRYGPDGRFTSTALEDALAPRGWLAGVLDALRLLSSGRRTAPFDLVVSPVLLAQLQRMRSGYTVAEGGTLRVVRAGEAGASRAGAALEALRRVAGTGVPEVSAYPLAAPLLPAMTGGGLARDLPAQLDRGRDLVRAALGVEPAASVFRPPGGALDAPGLRFLACRGVGVLLADPTTVERPLQPLGFAPPATERLEAPPCGSVIAVLPDPAVQALLDPAGLRADPILAAQVALGELASIWLEQPSVPRAIALGVPPGIPGGFARPFAYRVSRAPFLRPLRALDLAALHPPDPEAPPARLLPSRTGGFTRTYAESLRRTRRLLEDYRSMLVEEDPLPDALATRLLIAEGGQFVGNESQGAAFVRAVRDRLRAELAKVRPVVVRTVTLSSRTGTIPIRLTNATGRPLQVVVELASARIGLLQAVQEVELDRPERTLQFPVELRTTGRFPVRVLVRTPSGRVVSDAILVVRSTAYNRVALVITLGAALLLLALSSRRLLPRRRR
ncbi:MAG TPA: DUF6049 family protein [Actinomycetota bacterium]|nr:DUF6049 family protein [Actinomycetota bacterium]